MTSTYIDGDMFAADGGAMLRFVGGKDEGWDAKDPKDSAPAPGPGLLAASRPGTARREGEIYGYDKPNAPGRRARQGRTARTTAQYRLAGGDQDWDDLRAMYVVPGVEGAAHRRSSGCPATASTRRSSSPCPTSRRRPARAVQRAPAAPGQGDTEAHQEALTGAAP